MAERVVVAMSGGVDSSVALLKVLEAGYEPIGVTMKLWEYRDMGGNLLAESNCCPVEAVNLARDVCFSLGVPHYTLDFRDTFKRLVVDDFISEYLAGRTPNPCVRCNSYLKWDALIDYADQLGQAKIATGHYARISTANGQPQLLKGRDLHKDQSYVLWGIPRETLRRTVLPLGDLTKQEVRRLAEENGLATAHVPDSQDICFVADGDYRRFLQEQAGPQLEQIGSGDILDEAGVVLGAHPGYAHYTVGQRRGLGLSSPEPLYVKALDPAHNTITVAAQQSLYGSRCEVRNLNWLCDPPEGTLQVQARIRYNSSGAAAELSLNGEQAILTFTEPQLAITAGQSAVFYDGDVLLGGGVISRRLAA